LVFRVYEEVEDVAKVVEKENEFEDESEGEEEEAEEEDEDVKAIGLCEARGLFEAKWGLLEEVL